MRVDGFWAGAMDVADAVDLPRLAEQVGGYAALQRLGLGGWLDAGVPPEAAARWAMGRAFESRGLVIPLDAPAYPARLREILHPPAVLFVEGDPAALSGPCVGIVGTRGCTGYGVGVTTHLASELAAAGVVVVSGLARGIDAAAHRAAADRGRTVAVLGHGLAFTSPTAHRALRERIGQRGGAMVTAFRDEQAPRPYTFPPRNRWIAGLSERVVVVEAPVASGAMLTARHAFELDREVCAVPGPIGAPASEGCLRLIADGATVVTSVADFVASTPGRRPAGLADHFAAGATVDEVSRRTGRPITELLADVTRLELTGALVRLPGGRYAPGGMCS